MRKLMLAIVAGLLLVGSTAAEGLLYRLPADGSSVSFDLEMKMEMKGMEKNGRGSLLMSSVGKETVNGEACRWIEFKLRIDMDGKNEQILAKVLVPEKHLKMGETPIDHAVRGYLKERDREVEQINDFKGHKAGPIPVFLSGPLQAEKKLKKEVTDSGIGKIECEGITGTRQYEMGQEKLDVTFENRLSDKAPFGVVTSNMKIKIERNGQAEGSGTLTLRLVEIGKKAKSELPDSQ